MTYLLLNRLINYLSNNHIINDLIYTYILFLEARSMFRMKKEMKKEREKKKEKKGKTYEQ